MRSIHAALVALAASALATRAGAQAPRDERAVVAMVIFAAELSVELGPGTERCPDAAPYLKKEVAGELGYDPFEPGRRTPAGRFIVKIARVPSGLQATNEHTGPDGATLSPRGLLERPGRDDAVPRHRSS